MALFEIGPWRKSSGNRNAGSNLAVEGLSAMRMGQCPWQRLGHTRDFGLKWIIIHIVTNMESQKHPPMGASVQAKETVNAMIFLGSTWAMLAPPQFGLSYTNGRLESTPIVAFTPSPDA